MVLCFLKLLTILNIYCVVKSKSARKMPLSSFNGIIHEIPSISVDNFEGAGSRAYFLSHCHTDHTQGLYSAGFSDYLARSDDVFVYMSAQSAAIVCHESKDARLMEYIKPLKIGTSVITIPGDSKDGAEEQFIQITLIPAGHCFGSVMFMFKTLYKTVLYTGDFRISDNSVRKYAHFHELNGDIIKLDALYVDTTFQSCQHRYFPKRSESVECVIQEIKKWLSLDTNNKVALRTSAKYGYEFVFNDIYKCLGLKVYVGDEKWKLYSQFPDLVPGVTHKQDETRIHLCLNRNGFFKSHERCLPKIQNGDPTRIPSDTKIQHGGCENQNGDSKKQGEFLFMNFSAMRWSYHDLEDNHIKIHDKNIIDVCFATHCSRSELVYFVNYLSPKNTIGFPEPYKCGTEATIGLSCKRKPPSAEKVSNKIARKVDCKLLRQIFAD